MFAIMNGNNDLLNIRKFDGDNMPIWNSFKEKRFWFTLDKSQAQAQNILLNKKGEDSKVVEIVEVENKPDLTLAEHCDRCKVRGYVARDSKPEQKYWKNHTIPLVDRIPIKDQKASDWDHHDPEGEEYSIVV